MIGYELLQWKKKRDEGWPKFCQIAIIEASGVDYLG